MNKTLPALIANSEDPGDPNVTIVPGDPCNPNSPDTVFNTQNPFTDADGDGIADSSFADVALLTELANGAAGRPSRAQGVRPDQYNPNDPNAPPSRFWAQFRENARYAASMRVKSHGGMVQIAAPTSAGQWNSAFVGQMFNWIRHPNDSRDLDLSTVGDRELVWGMGQQSATVEPMLRRRGGALVSVREAAAAWATLAPPLAAFEQEFTRTFVRPTADAPPPGVDAGRKDDNWQRFNLASLNEWRVWRQGVALDPTDFNSGLGVRNLYLPRTLLTTASYSDELARIQEPDKDLATWGNAGQLGLRPGALKYYLGRITDLSLPTGGTGVPRGAFMPDGRFNDDTALMPNGTTAQGFVVVRELADYFHEMLRGHANFPNLDGIAGNDPLERRRQALMLAVNTVAFAAPRNSNGDIDLVYYQEIEPGTGTPREYVGYAPQPFFTQLVVYNKPGPGPGVLKVPHIALAVELYNPNDSLYPSNNPRHDLNMDQFGMSFEWQADTPAGLNSSLIYRLSSLNVDPNGTLADRRLDGRGFAVIAVHDGGGGANTWFEQQTPGNLTLAGVLIAPVPYPTRANATLVVKLWRYDSAGANPKLVDAMEARFISTGQPPTSDRTWYEAVQRDTRFERYLGTQNWQPARWRMVMNVDPDPNNTTAQADPEPNNLPDVEPPAGLLRDLGVGSPNGSEAPATGMNMAPCVPWYTMNGAATSVNIHGTARPSSFPTVGFLLFVPRVSHVNDLTVGANVYTPVTSVLATLWDKQPTPGGTGYSYALGNYPPADFGHMPVFDNAQPVDDLNDVTGFEATGRVPWGLLVFDYFTTHAPNVVDQRQIPGRIDLNTAPWYMLAGLPLVGPSQTSNLTPFSIDPNGDPTDISVAFWRNESGILAGTGADATTQRYPSSWLDAGALNGEWYRLGPYLAQASTAYRDRTPYISETGDPNTILAYAHWRNHTTGLGGRSYRQPRYDPATPDPNLASPRGSFDLDPVYNVPVAQYRRGFLTLGELANVIAFDGSSQTQLGGGPDTTVLGGGGLGNYAGGDFMKAVSLLALLDTHFLTTRSNTFTVYTTLIDREQPAKSVSSVVTIDRSNILPRLIWEDVDGDGVQDPPGPTGDRYTLIEPGGQPAVIARREFPYYGARYDE